MVSYCHNNVERGQDSNKTMEKKKTLGLHVSIQNLILCVCVCVHFSSCIITNLIFSELFCQTYTYQVYTNAHIHYLHIYTYACCIYTCLIGLNTSDLCGGAIAFNLH